MIPEVRDQFQLLQSVHNSIDAMTAELSSDRLVEKPREKFNNIASLLSHLTLTEKRFLGGISGGETNIDIMAPFQASEWNVEEILSNWRASIQQAEEVLATLTEEDLSSHGLKLHSGEMANKRQLITFMVLHAAHHRGQIPLIKKLLGV